MSASSLPSPSDIRPVSPKAKPGSRKAPIPIDAPTGFLSAMSLVTKEQLQPDYAPQASRRASKSPSLEDFAYQEPSEKAEPPGKLKRPTKKQLAAAQQAQNVPQDAPQEEPLVKAAPRKRATKKSAAATATTTTAIDSIEDNVGATKPKRVRKKAVVPENEGDAPALPKRVRKSAVPQTNHAVTDESQPAPKPPERLTKTNTTTDGTSTDTAIPAIDAIEPVTKPRSRKAKAAPSGAARKENGTHKDAIKPSTSINSLVRVESPINPDMTSPMNPVEQTSKSRGHEANSLGAADYVIANSAGNEVNLPQQQKDVRIASPHFEKSTSLPGATESSEERHQDVEHTGPHLASRRQMDRMPPPQQSDLPPSFQHQSFVENEGNTATLDDAAASTHLADCPLQDASMPIESNLSNVDEESPKAINFADLVGGFGYIEGETVTRHNSDEAGPRASAKPEPLKPEPVKKKREPKKKAAPKEKAEPKKKVEKKKKEPKPKVPKTPKPPKEPKPKAPRKTPKKALTITALATAAYRQQPVEAIEGSNTPKLTSYFAADAAPDTAATATGDMPPPKTGKRKSTGAKPASKRSKKDDPIQYKLESPGTAHRNMRNQEWLFGTSSQLAAAESPSEFRDLQLAIKASEGFGSSQDMESSQAVDIFPAASKMRVPSAPHGTDLSIGQASRDLWLSAARDAADGVYAADEGLGMIEEEIETTGLPELPTAVSSSPVPLSVPAQDAAVNLPQILSDDPSAQEEGAHDSGYVDIDDISSIASHGKINRIDPGTKADAADVQAPAQEPRTENLPSRTVLKNLDPNASISKQIIELDEKTPSPQKQVLAESITDAALSPIDLLSPSKRPRGRPRKTVTDISTSLATSDRSSQQQRPLTKPIEEQPSPISLLTPSSRPKGRPRKTVTDISTSSNAILPPPPSPKPRGRPPKLTTALSDPAPRSPKRPKLSKAATSQPLTLSSSPYLDIDDISDAEAASSPPSPPKRRRSKSPIVQPTLELSGPVPAVAKKPTTEKQLQAEWATISVGLFPRITAAVKAQPRTTDIKRPSWNEKILLYDPIVLEDLTAWLNGEGVRVEVESAVKVAPAKKGRKRKNGDGDADVVRDGSGTAEGTDGRGKEKEVQIEVVQEELRPWMVQKWCEVHSVCCLWKEGLRGGVRLRY